MISKWQLSHNYAKLENDTNTQQRKNPKKKGEEQKNIPNIVTHIETRMKAINVPIEWALATATPLTIEFKSKLNKLL